MTTLRVPSLLVPRGDPAALRARLGTLVRSALAGGAATLVDLAVLGACVALGVSPRLASFPALLAGAVVQFFGNRHFAFRAASGSVRRQAVLFGLTEVVALALNALLYDVAVRHVPVAAPYAMAVRAVTTNVVFLLWSHPVWQRVFRAAPAGAPTTEPRADARA